MEVRSPRSTNRKGSQLIKIEALKCAVLVSEK
jgi:hypothetical protein